MLQQTGDGVDAKFLIDAKAGVIGAAVLTDKFKELPLLLCFPDVVDDSGCPLFRDTWQPRDSADGVILQRKAV